MRLALIAVVLGCVVSASGGEPRRADVVVTAQRTRILQSGPACGRMHTIGEEEYHVVRVERGQLDATEIAVEVSCPADGPKRDGGTLRLYLDEKRPSSWPSITPKSKLPRRYAVAVEPTG